MREGSERGALPAYPTPSVEGDGGRGCVLRVQQHEGTVRDGEVVSSSYYIL